jgi:hypothetical protein
MNAFSSKFLGGVLRMVKKDYIMAILSFLLIPPVALLGGKIFISINPEIAAHTQNYVLNYWLLDKTRNACILAAFLVNVGLWFLSCYFLLRSKKQSYWWLPMGVFGPFGFIVLTVLGDHAEQPWDLYRRFVRRMNVYLRVVYELCAVYVVWSLAYEIMVLKRNLMIKYEAARTGVSTAQIINQQNASGGMWAFSEGLEVMYLVVLMYLLWPICFNFAGHLYMALLGRRREK